MVVEGTEVGTGIQEELDHLVVVEIDGQEEGSVAFDVFGLDAVSGCYEVRSDDLVAVGGGYVEERFIVAVLYGGDVGLLEYESQGLVVVASL